MFDWYRPIGVDSCPVCGASLDAWQGKDGPNDLLVWQQGVREPVERRAGAEEKHVLELRWDRQPLPESFQIYADDENDHEAIAQCVAVDGVWMETRLKSISEFRPGRRVLWPA
jgi:hypothetical protein